MMWCYNMIWIDMVWYHIVARYIYAYIIIIHWYRMLRGANQYGIWYVVVFDILFNLAYLFSYDYWCYSPVLSLIRSFPASGFFDQIQWVCFGFSGPISRPEGLTWNPRFSEAVDRSFIPKLGSEDIKKTIHSWGDIGIPCHDPLVFLQNPFNRFVDRCPTTDIIETRWSA